jgi:hypothetical protein
MVTMSQLRDAQPALWEHAAGGWRHFAGQANEAGRDLRRQSTEKLTDHWKDAVGQKAGQVLDGLANEYDCAAALAHGIAMLLEGLCKAVETAQRELTSAIILAEAHNLHVQDNGTATPWSEPDSQGNNGYDEAMEYKPRVERIIADAVEAATQADRLAADQFNRFKESISLKDTVQALDDFQAAAAQAEVKMLHYSLPYGQDSAAVTAWWNSLSAKEQHDLELALPVELVELDGVPG